MGDDLRLPYWSCSLSSRRRKPEQAAAWRSVCSRSFAAGQNLPRIALMADIPDDLVARRLEGSAEPTVSSTTPSPAPMWPPVWETTSMRRCRTSSASCCSCSGGSALTSAGPWIDSENQLGLVTM